MSANKEIDTWKKFDRSFSIEDSEMFNTKSFKIDYIQEKGLTATQLKRLRTEWIRTLPKLSNVEFAFFGHKITQEFFEAICSMPSLRGLWIKWSQLSDFSVIKNLRYLNYLIIGGSVKISSLSGLENLSHLRSLELNNFLGIKSLAELTDLKNLERLELYAGLDTKRLQIEDISALSNLKILNTLALDIKSKGVDIKPILGLKGLENLILPDSYFKEMTRKDMLRLFPNLKENRMD